MCLENGRLECKPLGFPQSSSSGSAREAEGELRCSCCQQGLGRSQRLLRKTGFYVHSRVYPCRCALLS